ncbi:MAG: hypothetical protein ACJ8D6_05200, partial [Sphingomicrobium sp.]
MVVAFIVAALADAVQTRTDSIGLYCTAAALRSSNVPVAEVQGLTFAVAEPDTLKFVYAEEFEH